MPPMRMLAVAGVMLAALALAVPSGAQDPAPAPLQVLQDVASDEDVTVAAQHTGQTRWTGSDLRSLAVVEDGTGLRLTLTVEDLVTETAPVVGGISYEIHLTARDAPYIIDMYYTGEDAADNTHAAWCEPGDFFPDCFEVLSVVADVAADTFTIAVPHDLLVASDGARLFKGDAVSAFQVTAQSQVASRIDGESGGAVTAEDAMPDTGVGTASWVIQSGLDQVGHLVLGAATPVRVSNGEATTFLFEVQLRNTLDRHDTAVLAASGFPPEWVVTFPQEEVRLEAGETVDVAVLVTTPFNHVHGDYKSFNVTATSRSDPLAVGSTALAVRYTRVPQPSGHHPTMFLHDDSGFLYLNALEEEELPSDEEPVARSTSSCSSSGGAYSGSSETVALTPPFSIGLDVDLARTGLAHIIVSTDLPLLGGTSIAGWFVTWEGDDRPSPCLSRVEDNAVMVVEKSAPLEMQAQGTMTVDLPIRGLPRGDYLQYSPDLHLGFILAYISEGGQDLGTPVVQPGSTFLLPLAEYHDPVDEYFSTLSGIELSSVAEQQRLVNAGETVVFRLQAENIGTQDGEFDLRLTGTHPEWARILGDPRIPLAGGASRELAVAVTPPAGTDSGETVDLTLHAVKSDDENVRSLIRLLATVDDSEDHPDQAWEVEGIDQSLTGKDAPVAPALAALAVAVAVVLRRRRQQSRV